MWTQVCFCPRDDLGCPGRRTPGVQLGRGAQEEQVREARASANPRPMPTQSHLRLGTAQKTGMCDMPETGQLLKKALGFSVDPAHTKVIMGVLVTLEPLPPTPPHLGPVTEQTPTNDGWGAAGSPSSPTWRAGQEGAGLDSETTCRFCWCSSVTLFSVKLSDVADSDTLVLAPGLPRVAQVTTRQASSP